jgi:hypothetical protein
VQQLEVVEVHLSLPLCLQLVLQLLQLPEVSMLWGLQGRVLPLVCLPAAAPVQLVAAQSAAAMPVHSLYCLHVSPAIAGQL